MNFSRLRLSKKQKRIAVIVLASIVSVNIFCDQTDAKKTIRNLRDWSSWSNGHDPNGYMFSGDSEDGKKPLTMAKIQSELPQQKGYGSIFQSFSPELFAGKKVRYSAALKTSKVNGSAALWMTDEKGDKVVAFDDMSNRAVTGTTDWKKYSIVLDIPNESDRLRVGFILKGGGSAWMREPEVVVANPDEKSTAIPFDSSKFTLNELKNSPSNLQFNATNDSYEYPINSISQWGVHTDNKYQVQISKEVLDQGKPSVQLDSTGDPGDGFASVYQSIAAKNYRNKRVSFSADMKNTSNADWTTIFMQINGKGHVIAFDALEKKRLKNLKNWTRVSIVLDVPPESEKIKIGFLHAGKEKAWISNLSFAVVGKQVPVTSTSSGNETLPQSKLEPMPGFKFD